MFQNDVSEQEQRWGAKTIEGSGRKEHIRYEDTKPVSGNKKERNAGQSGCCVATGRGSESKVQAVRQLVSPNMGNI